MGDSLVRLLEAAGHEVEREYYVNDAGSQIGRFADSIAARMAGHEPPEDGYAGAYVTEIAERLRGRGGRPGRPRGAGAARHRADAGRGAPDAGALRRPFDTWFSERSLYAEGEVEEALAELEKRGHTYRHEDALWLRTTDFGDDKDRVLIRSNGEATYLTPDIAYHWDKLQRGFDRLIDVLGADHHGYVARVRAAIEALGADPERFEALLMSLVHIVEGGERVQMSKRSGDFVTLDELLDDIGVDATRWFMLWRSHETTVDIDLGLARSQSSENPVYYVQYAHARIASILRKAGEGAQPEVAAGTAERGRRWRTARRFWSSACWSSPKRCGWRRRGGPRTGSAPTRPRSRPTSTPSTATARWSAPRAKGSRARGWRSAWRRSRRSPSPSGCWGSPRPSGCDAAGPLPHSRPRRGHGTRRGPRLGAAAG